MSGETDEKTQVEGNQGEGVFFALLTETEITEISQADPRIDVATLRV
jgi:hypothetical protein